jgi:cupin fold WbuC family metalloprotein
MRSVVQFIDSDLFGPLKQKALDSQRLRTNYNFHSGDEDNPHRFLNVLAKGTFVPPHRHLDPPKSETILILEGRVGLFHGSSAHLVNQGRHFPDGIFGGKRRAALAFSG